MGRYQPIRWLHPEQRMSPQEEEVPGSRLHIVFPGRAPNGRCLSKKGPQKWVAHRNVTVYMHQATLESLMVLPALSLHRGEYHFSGRVNLHV